MTHPELSFPVRSQSAQPTLLSSASATIAEPVDSWRREYPFKNNFMEIGTHRMHYVDERPSEDVGRDPILMVHGNPTWSFYWRRLISSLSPNRRIVAVDHLGCGFSDKPTNYDYCLKNHVDNLCQLVEKLDLKNVTLMAHDWGGAIGLGALLARKERFKKIVLFNTAAFPPPFIPFRIRVCRWPVIGKIGVQGLNMFARAATFMGTERPGGLPKIVADGLLAPYDNWKNRIAIYRFVKDIPLSSRHKTWQLLEEIESGLNQVADWPILMMWGIKDWCFRPECLDRLSQHWPAAEVHRIEDAGHYVVEDAANQIDQTVSEFLSRHQS